MTENSRVEIPNYFVYSIAIFSLLFYHMELQYISMDYTDTGDNSVHHSVSEIKQTENTRGPNGGNMYQFQVSHTIKTLRIVNLCFSSGVFPTPCKSSIIFPLIKKQGLDPEILKNYRPVANLSFISIISEKAIATQIHDHLINKDIVDNFQSTYKAGHSCETALLRVYNDIVTTVGRGNGTMLVLLDLSAAFDTIDHDNLFCILEKYVGICGNALKLIKSYFSNRT